MNKEIAYTIVDNHLWESKLPPEVKAKWLAALRSGNYLQARNSIRAEITGEENGDGTFAHLGWKHCCLSVLAEEYEGKWERAIAPDDCGFVVESDHGYEVETHVLPPNEWLTLEDMEFLASMNDGSGNFSVFDFRTNEHSRYFFSFEEIADIIEAKL